MIKSLEKFKKFNEVGQSLNKKFLKIEIFFDDEFSNQIKIIFNDFDVLLLDDLENKLCYIKSYKNNVKNFECDQKTKDECLSFIDECLFFINDLIMNHIIENI